MIFLFKKIFTNFLLPIKNFGFFYGFRISFINISNSFQYFKTKQIGFFNKDFKSIKYILKSGNYSSSPYPSNLALKFSKKFLNLNKAKYGVCISNGTEALKVSYKASGLKYGDEIIMPALTFHTAASAALELGIIPRFIDIEENTLCINSNEIEKNITKKIKAVVIVHLGSVMCNLDKIVSICKKNNLILIEDCAHAHGSMWRGKGAGTHGDFGCYSFQSSKIISSGEGGFIIKKKKKNLNKCMSYINCGRGSEPFKTLGLNNRLTDIHCALLINSLKKFNRYLNIRNSNIDYFTNELSKINGIKVLKHYKNQNRKSGYSYAFKVDKKIKRKVFVDMLGLRGVKVSEHLYAPVYITPEFGWKDSPIDVSYTKTKCLLAEKTYFLDTVWIGHPFFLLNKKSINHALKMISDCSEFFYKQKN